jgi:hypothetical protein
MKNCPFFNSFGFGWKQILESIIHDAQIRSQQADTLDGADAYLEVSFGEFDIFSQHENAGPFFGGFGKEVVDAVGRIRSIE